MKIIGFLQFEVIINVLDSSFRFVSKHMLWFYDQYNYCSSESDTRAERVEQLLFLMYVSSRSI